MVENWTGSFWRAIGKLPKKLSISKLFYPYFEKSNQPLDGEPVQAMPGNSKYPEHDRFPFVLLDLEGAL